MNIDASNDFYEAFTEIDSHGKKYTTEKLSLVVHPEEKRKIIGDTFMRVAQREISKLGLVASDVLLAQGTLRPDIIESGSPDISKTAHTIKTHHNDTNLVRQLRASGSVVEPLSDYHKDEVRRLGKTLGLPESIVMRHPFPGPGLAVRIICYNEPSIDSAFEETNNFLQSLVTNHSSDYENDIQHNLKDYEKPILESIRKNKIQAILLPIKTVGVQGDGRSYNYPCGLLMEDPDWDQLFMLARLIPRLKHNINRVLYIFGSHLKETVIKNITPTTMTPEVIHLLQNVDDIATSILTSSNSLSKLSQVPIILFPVTFGKPGTTHSVAIRTIITFDFMTGRAAIPGQDISVDVLNEIVNKITQNFPQISRVVYDLTSKPPGTTEWE
jgi:GMP synthase (glutamine-hydrolysing)